MAERLQPPPLDRSAYRGAVVLLLPPAVFLLQFTLLYGVTALACRFRWDGGWFGVPLVPALALVVTALACAGVLAMTRGARAAPTEGVATREYDLAARHDFVAKARALVAALSIGAMLLVALPVLLTPACT